MALFKRDYNKPGPGVPKNAPKKKGIARFFEIFARDFGNLVKLNLIYLACILPAITLFTVAIINWLGGNAPMFLVFSLLSLVATVLVGPAKTALYNLLTRMLRDEPGFVWHNYKKVFKDNFKNTLVPGVLYSVLLGSQVIAAVFFLFSEGTNYFFMAIYIFSILVFSMAAPYFFLQASYLDLGTTGLLGNSLRFMIGFLPRSFAGMLLCSLLIGAQLVAAFGLLILPVLILTVIFGITVPELILTMWCWPQVDKAFKIDETLRKRTADKLDEELGTDREPLE